MTRRFLFTFITFVLCVPCFAEELPSVPELIKRMYDYRMAIENMRAEVTVTYPVDTRQPIKETAKTYILFIYDKERVRCDWSWSVPKSTRIQFWQYLSTPDIYFTRHTSPETSHINEGNSLFVCEPLEQPFDTLDPRRIGTDWTTFDAIRTNPFNYDVLLELYYSPHEENYTVSIDYVDGEKLYKVSWQASDVEFFGSYWINPQKGYNLVRCEGESEVLDLHDSYNVTLGKFASNRGDMWFPQKITHKYRHEDYVSEERVVVDTIEFDVQDETALTLAGLDIPVGYRVNYFGEGGRYWDGKELVERIPFASSVEPVNIENRKVFWVVNGVGFAIIAIFFLIKWIQSLRRGSN